MPSFIRAQTITTIAGTGTAGYNGEGIAATTAELSNPQGLAVDAAGNIFVSDLTGCRIRKIDISTGLITTIAGTGVNGYNGDGLSATTTQISNPSSLAFDANGDLFFTDRGNNRVRKITFSTGLISTIAGTGTGGFNGDNILATTAELYTPNEVAFDANGDLFIADWVNYRVRKVNMVTGIISTIAGTGTSGYNGDGIAATTAQFYGPCGIIFDNIGNIYLADYQGARIRKITISSGLISTFAGTGTQGFNGDGIAATAAQLAGCAYIRFDAAENMYVGDALNQRVRKITKITGLISTVAGTGSFGYNGDGIPATTANLYDPFNIYFDQLNCNLLIADYGNNRLRKVTGGFAGCPSPVAPGNLVSCQVLPAITITNANKTTWVPVFDSSGNLAAEINANGNGLGTINTTLYTKTGTCRVDPSHRVYLNRNITITPQNQPSTPVSIRLYILKAELDSLRTALNDQGQPTGVASIADVDIFKNSDACATVGSITALPLTASTGTYNSDYYLQANVSGFSSFYFANKLLTSILPVKISWFTGVHNGMGNLLTWIADCNSSVRFIIERSTDGTRFMDIGNLMAATTDCNQPFNFTDPAPDPMANFYRLHIIESGGTSHYSNIILLPGNGSESLLLSVDPTIVTGNLLNLKFGTNHAQQVAVIICDMQCRRVYQQMISVQAGSSTTSLATGKLGAGLYWVYAIGNTGRSNMVRIVQY